ncbi:MAG: Athe_2463 domain-containing protein [Bacillota bacterium]
MSSIPYRISVQAAAIQDCPLPLSYDSDSLLLIEQNNIPTSVGSNGKYKINGNYLSNKCGLGTRAVVYGSPASVSGNQFDQGQWRYLGYDINGVVYRNWLFRSDSRATLHVAKNWVKNPWDEPVGRSKKIQDTIELTSHPDAKKWIESIVDPYKESPTFLQSYNKRKGTNWDGNTLKPYVIIQQVPTDFSPGVVQMWNIWTPDGSWWYEMFIIPPLNPLEIKKQPDLEIDPLVVQSDAWIGDSVPVKITTKNKGQENSGPFTVGIVGTSTKSDVISNVPPGAVKTVTVNVTSSTSGIKKFTAKTDFGLAVAESNEDNNTKSFQIAFNKKNEPTTPVAIISHLEGDHRAEPEISIKPAADPKLDDKLSYSPGKEAITLYEWKYKTPSGTTIQKNPVAKDFATEGKYLVELRVTNSAEKVSEWALLIINVAEQVTPTPTPEPTPPPRPELKAAIRFVPDKILAGETSSLLNSSDGFDSFEWTFSSNLDPLFTDKSKYEYYDQTFMQAGTYRAKIKVSDSSGSATSEATLTVIDPSPVAVVAGATKVIEGRPFPFPYHLNNSYTPLADRGITIDHSKSEKRYKRVGDLSYTLDFPATNNLALGQYSFEGKVYDSTGRTSEWAELLLDIVPDMPPTIEVIAPEESYRSNGFMLYMEAESPDADILNHLFLEERYDMNGNGNFDEEAWTTLYDGTYKTTHSLNYATVGKRQYRATVTENYGKTGTSSIASTDILNYAPEVNFSSFGVTQQPGQGEESGPPVTSYTPQSIFRSWTLKKPYAGGNGDKLGWKADTTTINTKKGQMVNFNLKYPNAGNGLNSRNKYALAPDLVGKQRWKVQPLGACGCYDNDYGLATDKIFNNNRLYTYQRFNQGLLYTEKDAVTGVQLRPSFFLEEPQYGSELKGDEKFYRADVMNQNSVKITVHNNEGKKIDVHSFNLVGLDSRSVYVSFFELMPDFKSMIIAIAHNDYDYVELKYYKYSFETRTVEWVATGSPVSKYVASGNDTPDMSVTADGTIYISGKVVTKIFPNGSRIDSPVVTGYSDGSAISISNDGKYLYRTNMRTLSGDQASNGLTTYNANDLSVVNHYSRFPNYLIYEQGVSSSFSPIVREDGIVIVVEYGVVYFFSRTGSFLFSSNTLNPNWARTYEAGILSNNHLAIPYYDKNWTSSSTEYKYALYDTSTSSIIKIEPVRERNDYGAGGGHTTVTPVLPNGSFFIFDRKNWPHTVTPFVSSSGNANLQNIDANTVGIFDDNWGGLLYDAGSIMRNYAMEFNVSVNDVNNAKMIGTGFHIQNEKNMYAMEWSKDTLTLYKVVNGVKTILQSVALARSPFTTYPIKAEAINGTLRVYVNYAKKIEVTDGTYVKGAAGIMSLGQSSASFSNVKKTNYGDTYTEETYESVLVNDPIFYDKLFKDVENDPMGTEEWSYSHNPNFFENPEGLSAFSGQTYRATVNALEKPGVYEITFRAQDNPGLSVYRKWSESVKKLLYVHRRPVALPDVRFTGRVFTEGEALDYDTYDKSYDPDIAHLLSDKLFRTRWADETTWTTGKRQYYNRPGVELIVQEQVKDIHGAWSYWGQYIVYKDSLPAVNQTKPVMTITYPSGTTAAAPTVLATEPAITWTYFDAENDPQDMFRLSFNYADTNELALYLELEGSALNYTMLKGSIIPGRVVKVQGQVFSAGAWSNLSNIRYFVLDLPPETHLLTFNGTDAANPIFTNRNRPQLRTFTVDPENHPIAAIDYEVFQASNGVKVVDTNSATALANYTPAALADGLHYWRARAFDNYLWGKYSVNGFFFVDTVKPVDVDEKLEIEPTAVTVKFNEFSDPAPSSGHAARTFYLQKVNADGSVTNIDLNGDGTAEYSTQLALNRQSYRVAGLIPGQEYRLTVLDYDIAGNEGHFAYIYFVTNRPPTADFDWSPKPLYEGDTATFLSDVDDPDGDTLSVEYELTSPAGEKSSFSYTLNDPNYPPKGPMLRMVRVGTWIMRMTVSDGIAEPVIVTKTVQVHPLSVTGYVKHTELWDEHRQDFNTKKSGNADSPRGYAVFWAGEKFMLEADTSVTGTTTRAERVDVQMGTYSSSLVAANTAHTKWKGEMWDADFGQLAKGQLTFTFTAFYNNGAIKIDTVDVTIDGQTLEIIGVHRVQ